MTDIAKQATDFEKRRADLTSSLSFTYFVHLTLKVKELVPGHSGIGSLTDIYLA